MSGFEDSDDCRYVYFGKKAINFVGTDVVQGVIQLQFREDDNLEKELTNAELDKIRPKVILCFTKVSSIDNLIEGLKDIRLLLELAYNKDNEATPPGDSNKLGSSSGISGVGL